jgi:hypothetical protein
MSQSLIRIRITEAETAAHIPHLNGKVEGSQRSDGVEFYATIKRNNPQIGTKPKGWQHFYN